MTSNKGVIMEEEKNSRLKSASQQRIEQFMKLAGQAVPDGPIMPNAEIRKLRASLILEEALETVRDLGFAPMINLADLNGTLFIRIDNIALIGTGDEDLRGVADGCADIAVVTTGTLSACGLADVSIQECVDINNLDKFGPGHSFREDGKLIKPPGHKPPDLDALIEVQRKESVLNQIGKSTKKVFGLVNFEEPGMPWTKVSGKFELIKLDDGSDWEGVPHWELRDPNDDGTVDSDILYVPADSVIIIEND